MNTVYTITKEIIESNNRNIDRNWTLEEMGDMEVEEELAQILSEEIDKELEAAGHGTRAERDQKIIDQMVKAFHDINFDDAKEVI